MKPKTKSNIEVILIYLFFLLMFIIIAYPLVWAVMMSLNPGTNMLVTNLFPENPTFAHYKWLFTDPRSDYLIWYKNSLFVAIANALGSIVITSLIAYAFSRYKFICRKYCLYMFLLLLLFLSLLCIVVLYFFLY